MVRPQHQRRPRVRNSGPALETWTKLKTLAALFLDALQRSGLRPHSCRRSTMCYSPGQARTRAVSRARAAH
jgi:hypothetical protein